MVMSSCFCKYGEGAGFPFQVEYLEDGAEDVIHAFYVSKTMGWVRRHTVTTLP